MLHENERVARTFIDAVLSGDKETSSAMLADDVIVHWPGNNVIAGDGKGREEFFKRVGLIMAKTNRTYRPELHDVAVGDDHAVALFRVTARRDGKAYSYGHAIVFHVHNGKIAEAWPVDTDPVAFDALLA